MPTVPDGFVRIVMQFLRTGDANPYDVTFGVDPTGDSGTIQAILADVADAWNDVGSLKSLCPSNVKLDRVRGQYGGVGPDVVSELVVNEAGSDSAGDLAPPNVSVVVKKITGFAGQKFRGRMYQPWVKEVQVDDAGLLSGGAVTAYQTAWGVFLLALAAKASIDGMVLLHQDNTATPIINLSVRSKIGSQKRRLHL